MAAHAFQAVSSVQALEKLFKTDSLAPPQSRNPLVRRMTVGLLELYSQRFGLSYEPHRNPRRVLTKPAQPAVPGGHDNKNADYILYVNDTLGSSKNQRYVVLELLGCGTFGQVVKARNVDDPNDIVAIKVIKNKPAYFNQGFEEVRILEKLNNADPKDKANIVRVKGSFVFRNHLCIVFELLSVNLYELLKQNHFRGLSSSLIRAFVTRIVDALVVLSNERIAHCDLKPENILLSSLTSPEVKLVDFGSACVDKHALYSYIQSRFYRSPEVLLGCNYGCAIDIWSLGCIAAELFVGLPLFPGSSEFDQFRRIVESRGHPPGHMLRRGKFVHKFYKLVKNDNGQQKFVLKSAAEFERDSGKKLARSKKYFVYDQLEDIIMHYPLKKSLSPQARQRELRHRKEFVHFASFCLQTDPAQRLTARQLRTHPFLTGQGSIDDWAPEPDARQLDNAVVARQTDHKSKSARVRRAYRVPSASLGPSPVTASASSASSSSSASPSSSPMPGSLALSESATSSNLSRVNFGRGSALVAMALGGSPPQNRPTIGQSPVFHSSAAQHHHSHQQLQMAFGGGPWLPPTAVHSPSHASDVRARQRSASDPAHVDYQVQAAYQAQIIAQAQMSAPRDAHWRSQLRHGSSRLSPHRAQRQQQPVQQQQQQQQLAQQQQQQHPHQRHGPSHLSPNRWAHRPTSNSATSPLYAAHQHPVHHQHSHHQLPPHQHHSTPLHHRLPHSSSSSSSSVLSDTAFSDPSLTPTPPHLPAASSMLVAGGGDSSGGGGGGADQPRRSSLSQSDSVITMVRQHHLQQQQHSYFAQSLSTHIPLGHHASPQLHHHHHQQQQQQLQQQQAQQQQLPQRHYSPRYTAPRGGGAHHTQTNSMSPSGVSMSPHSRSPHSVSSHSVSPRFSSNFQRAHHLPLHAYDTTATRRRSSSLDARFVHHQAPQQQQFSAPQK